MRVILLCGAAGSGKDTVARMLTHRHWVRVGSQLVDARQWEKGHPEAWPGTAYGEQVALADALKELVHQLYEAPPELLWGPSALRNQPLPGWGDLTTRHALQILGTEVGRSIHPETWVRAAERRIMRVGQRGQLVVISDVRFPDEVAFFQARYQAEVWFIERPQALNTGEGWRAHSSEQHLDVLHAFAKHVIQNTGSLTDLRVQVMAACGAPAQG